MNKEYIVDLKYDNYAKKFELFLKCHNIKYEMLDDLAMFLIETTPRCIDCIKTFYYIDDITENINIEVEDIIGDANILKHEKNRMYENKLTVEPTAKELWFRENLSISNQWQRGIIGKGVSVAIIDSGIASHKYLDVAGRVNFTKSKTDKDTRGSGTIAAGIIAANNPKVNIRGVAYGCKLYGVKVVEDDESVDMWNINKSIEWCIDNKIKVAVVTVGIKPNMITSQTYLENLTEIIEKSYAKGLIVVAAVGSHNAAELNIPASIYKTFSVTGIRLKGNEGFDYNSIELLTNVNTDIKSHSIDFSAPGADITTTVLDGSFSSAYSSTGISAAYLAGGIALLINAIVEDNKKLNKKEGIDPDSIYRVLIRNRINTEGWGWMPAYKAGRGIANFENR